ncbi:MAG TPA: T9SS type A sorting domain-containing protein [Flavobacteriales bacterium]|nr:T9SS type A sorting domain-containing protein [Flavobacteriales bacterium]
MRSFITAASLAIAGGCAAQLGVTTGEYFWDADPVAGNGTALVASDGAFGSAVEGAMATVTLLPAVGTHTFSLRVRDEDTHWGPVFSTVVEVFAATAGSYAQQVGLAEYFWDNDPGAGSGTPLVAFDGAYDQALEQVIATVALPAVGTHVLYMRARDVQGAWGPLFGVVVDVGTGVATFPEIRVAAAEYWFDTDPGAGMATPMFAADNTFSDVMEAIKGSTIPTPVDMGVHVLWMRAGDPNSGWGPPFGVVVNMDTTLTGSVGVAPVAEATGLRLLPNPTEAAQGFALLVPADVKEARVLVLDAQGRTVLDRRYASPSRIEVPTAGFAAGVYPVSIILDGAVHQQRIVIR